MRLRFERPIAGPSRSIADAKRWVRYVDLRCYSPGREHEFDTRAVALGRYGSSGVRPGDGEYVTRKPSAVSEQLESEARMLLSHLDVERLKPAAWPLSRVASRVGRSNSLPGVSPRRGVRRLATHGDCQPASRAEVSPLLCASGRQKKRAKRQPVAGLSQLHCGWLIRRNIKSARRNHFTKRTLGDTRQPIEKAASSLKTLPLANERVYDTGGVLPCVLTETHLFAGRPTAQLTVACMGLVLRAESLELDRAVVFSLVRGCGALSLSLPQTANLAGDENRQRFGHGTARKKAFRQLLYPLSFWTSVAILLGTAVGKQRVYGAHTESEQRRRHVRRAGELWVAARGSVQLLYARVERSERLASRNSDASKGRCYPRPLQRRRANNLSARQRARQHTVFSNGHPGEAPVSDVSPLSNARFELPPPPAPTETTVLSPACARSQPRSCVIAQAIPMHRENRIQDNPPAKQYCPWPVPPLGIHPVGLTADGDHIRQINGGETLARMLCSGQHEFAQQEFFALCTEQTSARTRPGVIDRRRGAVEGTVRLGAVRVGGNRSHFEKPASRARSRRQF